MRCTKPIRLMHLNHVEYPDGLLVPCGKCLACRIARRQEWSMRVIHELAGYKDAVFLTLTYADDYLPENGSLVVADLQKFLRGCANSMQKEVTVLSFVTMLVVSMVIVMVAPIIMPLSAAYHYATRIKPW